jgi:hypothetical protein
MKSAAQTMWGAAAAECIKPLFFFILYEIPSFTLSKFLSLGIF